jgi:hypothetical protein
LFHIRSYFRVIGRVGISSARQKRDNGGALAEPIPFAELELRIALLPRISRAAHLGGPAIHARRLVQLWRGSEMTAGEISEVSNDELVAQYTVLGNDGAEAQAIYAEARTRAAKPIAPAPGPPETPRPSDRAAHWGDDDVPLSQAFRLLDVEAVARAIANTALMSDNDYPNDPVHWPLPPLGDMLPELQAAVWEALLDGALLVEAIKGLNGTRRRAVLPVELARLRPDWSLSRLCLGKQDEFISARVRRAPAKPVKKNWRERPSDEAVDTGMREIAKGYGSDARPALEDVWKALKTLPGLEEVTREQVRKSSRRKLFRA